MSSRPSAPCRTFWAAVRHYPSWRLANISSHSYSPCRTFFVYWTLLDKMSGRVWPLCRTSAEVCRTCSAYFAITVYWGINSTNECAIWLFVCWVNEHYISWAISWHLFIPQRRKVYKSLQKDNCPLFGNIFDSLKDIVQSRMCATNYEVKSKCVFSFSFFHAQNKIVRRIFSAFPLVSQAGYTINLTQLHREGDYKLIVY